MKKQLVLIIILIAAGLLAAGVTAMATTIGTNVSTAILTASGAATLQSTLTVTGLSALSSATLSSTLGVTGLTTLTNASTTGVITLGDAATDKVVLNSRVATVNNAGSAIDVAANYGYGEGMELRYTVSAWPTGQSNFQGILLKVRSNAVDDAGKGQRGMEVESSASNISMNNLEGGYFYAYQRGTTARNIGSMYGVTAELMFDDNSNVTFSTSTAAAFRGIVKTDNTMVNAATKLQGIEILFGTTDGVAGTVLAGINLKDDPATSGNVTLQYGLKMNSLSGIGVADIVLGNGDTIKNSAASTTLISGKLGVATSTASVALAIGSGVSSTIDISKGCFQGNSYDGTRYHFWIQNDGNIGTGTGNCP